MAWETPSPEMVIMWQAQGHLGRCIYIQKRRQATNYCIKQVGKRMESFCALLPLFVVGPDVWQQCRRCAQRGLGCGEDK